MAKKKKIKIESIIKTNIIEILDNDRGSVIELNEEGREWLKSKKVITQVTNENINNLLNPNENININTTSTEIESKLNDIHKALFNSAKSLQKDKKQDLEDKLTASILLKEVKKQRK